MKKKVGIVLESYDEVTMKGHLATSEVKVEFDEMGRLQIINEIIRNSFELNMEKGSYSVSAGASIEIAKEIGRQLKKIGFSSLILKFNDQEIPIE